MNNKSFWEFILNEIQNDHDVMLITVVDASGDTPGRQGFKMAVSDSGAMLGTIGGGTIESLGIDLAKSIFASGDFTPRLKEFSLSNNFNIHSDEMICGGKLSLSFFPILHLHLASISEIADIVSSHRPAALYFSSDHNIGISSRTLQGKCFTTDSVIEWSYEEPLNAYPEVHIIGGGHVALALSKILSMLDYRIFVYDSRPEVETLLSNNYVEKKIMTPFDSIGDLIPESNMTYVVIMTPKHQADAIALKQVIRKDVKYIGLMASPKKFREITAYLIDEGIDPALIGKVHSPIGLPISSETPAEIAVSIASEIIKIYKS